MTAELAPSVLDDHPRASGRAQPGGSATIRPRGTLRSPRDSGGRTGGAAMAVLEIWDSRGCGHRTLDAGRHLVGSGDGSDILLDDPTVSGVHFELERVGAVWLVRDLASRNGTLVNGVRLVSPHRLRHGDEIVAGRTRLVYLARATVAAPSTQPLAELPELTRAEREVLVELCRPLLSGNPFTPPATVNEISRRRVTGKGATTQILVRLYDKFGVYEDPSDRSRRRVDLANEAVQRGAVTAQDLTRG